MKYNAIKRKTICSEIVEQIKQAIRNGDLKPGEKLPPEKDLAEAFDVGRSSIREAVIVLNSIGLVKKTSDGSYVNDKVDLNYSDIASMLLLSESDYEELYEARKQIETTIVGITAKKADAEDIELLEEILNEMTNPNISIEYFAHLDADFHANIALASKNKVLYEFISAIRDFLGNQVTEKLRRLKNQKNYKVLDKTLDEHKTILEAIKSRDVEKAKRFMYKHLDDAENVFLSHRDNEIGD